MDRNDRVMSAVGVEVADTHSVATFAGLLVAGLETIEERFDGVPSGEHGLAHCVSCRLALPVVGVGGEQRPVLRHATPQRPQEPLPWPSQSPRTRCSRSGVGSPGARPLRGGRSVRTSTERCTGRVVVLQAVAWTAAVAASSSAGTRAEWVCRGENMDLASPFAGGRPATSNPIASAPLGTSGRSVAI